MLIYNNQVIYKCFKIVLLCLISYFVLKNVEQLYLQLLLLMAIFSIIDSVLPIANKNCIKQPN